MMAALGSAAALGGAALGLMPGAADAKPVVNSALDTVSAGALDIFSPTTGRFNVVATRCRLTSADESGSVPCSLSAHGVGQTGTFRLSSADVTVNSTLALGITGGLNGTGTAQELGAPPPATPIAAQGQLTSSPHSPPAST